jgi:DNA-binding NarL/FixJ family response regulator
VIALKQHRIIIADDHPIFRKGLRDIIETDSRFHVIAEAGDGDEALRLARTESPDALVLDVEMPLLDGLEVVKRLHEEESPVAVLILTMHQTESIFNRAMDHGVTGYLLKDSAAADIINALHAVMDGKHFISPALTEQALNHARMLKTTIEEFHELSPMERVILERISSAKTSVQIAEELCISPRTVENHRFHIGQKLGLRGSYSLLRYALENRDLILHAERDREQTR